METFVNALTAPFSAEELMRLLPHRPPFFFLKRLREWAPGRRALSEVEFDGSEEFFRGHFPGHPIVPGVILIEAAAQTAGLALAQASADVPAGSVLAAAPAGSLPALAKVKEFRFRAPAHPCETLAIEAVVTARFDTSGVVAVTVRRGATLLAEGELMVALAQGARAS